MNLETLRAFCLTLPGTTEDVKWEDHLCFSVGGKMYYVTSFNHPTSSLKVPDADFDVISSMEGIIPAPYMARNKWVQIASLDRFGQKEWEHYIRQSYELVKSKLPKKLQMELESTNTTSRTSKTKAPEKSTKKANASKKSTEAKKSSKPAAKKTVKKNAAAKPVKKTTAKKKTSSKKTLAKRQKRR